MDTIAGVRIPDSALARDAAELARSCSPTFLLRHVQRTYVLGTLLTARAGLTVRDELAYVAAVLHDLGLTESYEGTRRFEVEGATAAREWARANGFSDDEARTVWDAIALHTSMGIAPEHAPESALVHWGAGADVVGMGVTDADAPAVAEILAALPREDFASRFGALVDDVARRHPECYAQTWLAATAARHAPEPLPTSESMLGVEPFAGAGRRADNRVTVE